MSVIERFSVWLANRREERQENALQFATALVAKLELKSGGRYILIFDAHAVQKPVVDRVMKILYEHWGIDPIMLRVSRGKPADVVAAVDVSGVSPK